LVLKEEGVPVPAGAELGVELETSYGSCKLGQQAHISVNAAKQDKIAVEAPGSGRCSDSEYFAFGIADGVKEITATANRKAILLGAPLVFRSQDLYGPERHCTYEADKFVGAFPVMGHAVIEGRMKAKINRQESVESEERCNPPQSLSTSFVITLLGRDNKPLETELRG
jgi:hypothetical protein